MKKCRVCKTTLIKFFSLGKMPLVNAFLRKEDIKKEKKFDLTLGFCPNCYLVQLIKTVDPKELFRNYVYFSSVTKSIVDHSQKTAAYFTRRFKLSSKCLVLEIGSNDGVHLQFYQKVGIKVLGIDPAKNIAKVANERGIETIVEFFNLNLAKKLRSERIQADLIYGANVFAHVPKILDFVKGVKLVLAKEGTAVFESPYIKGFFENKFDTIYHEHVFYYSLLALDYLFKKENLAIYDVEFVPMHGGSLRIFVSHKGIFPVSLRVRTLLKKERQEDFDIISTYRKMGANVKSLKRTIVGLLTKLKREGKTIVAYGASAKGMILLNHFGISKYLNFIVDKSGAKQGLYTPGTHMLVYPPSKIKSKKPDYLLILSWNIKDEILSEYEWYRRQGGKFIIPIPKISIL